MKNKTIQLTLGLTINETRCPCGKCGKSAVTLPLLIRYTLLRYHYGKPLHIASVCRCPEHNRAVKGSPKSQHMQNCAMDITCPAGYNPESWAVFCRRFFSYVITGYTHEGKRINYKTIVHVDCRHDDITTFVGVASFLKEIMKIILILNEKHIEF